MDKFRRLVEIASNLALIVLTVVLGYILIGRYSLPPAQVAPAASAAALRPGTKLSIKNVDFSQSERNLVLALSTNCHFCSDSMSFYQRLVKENAEKKMVRTIGSFPQDLAESNKYLSEKSVSFDEIIKADASQLPVRGTPTLILVDKNGTVVDSWGGKLPPEKEKEVVGKLFSTF
jgi:hypothetical protein